MPQEKSILVFFACVVQGLLQSKQSVACGTLKKSMPWGVSCLSQSIIEIKQLGTLSSLPQNLVKVRELTRTQIKIKTYLREKLNFQKVYANYLEDEMDQLYVHQLHCLLFASIGSNKIEINGVRLPMPQTSTRKTLNRLFSFSFMF